MFIKGISQLTHRIIGKCFYAKKASINVFPLEEKAF